MTATPDGIRVEIYDQEYRMRGDLDAAYIEELARLVDGKMRTIAERTQTVDSLRVAILAALNIADEYQQLKAKYEALAKDADERVGECARRLDQILNLEV
jgi:cell division protein ZapA